MVNTLIDSDAVNKTLTREPYDMIDSDKLVVKPSTFVRGREGGLVVRQASGQRKRVDVVRDQPRKWIGGQAKGLKWCGTSFTT